MQIEKGREREREKAVTQKEGAGKKKYNYHCTYQQ